MGDKSNRLGRAADRLGPVLGSLVVDCRELEKGVGVSELMWYVYCDLWICGGVAMVAGWTVGTEDSFARCGLLLLSSR